MLYYYISTKDESAVAFEVQTDCSFYSIRTGFKEV